MSDKKISQLSAAAVLTGSEVVPIVQSASTVKTTTQDIADLAAGVAYTSYVARIVNTAVTEIENNTGVTFTWTPNMIFMTIDLNLAGQNYLKVYASATTLNGSQLALINLGTDGSGGTNISISRYPLTGGPADNSLPILIEIRIYP